MNIIDGVWAVKFNALYSKEGKIVIAVGLVDTFAHVNRQFAFHPHGTLFVGARLGKELVGLKRHVAGAIDGLMAGINREIAVAGDVEVFNPKATTARSYVDVHLGIVECRSAVLAIVGG